MIDENRRYGANKTAVGEFEFTGEMADGALLSAPLQYTIRFNNAVAGLSSVNVTAEDLGFMGRYKDESLFIKQFRDAALVGRVKVVEYDSPPFNKEPRSRHGAILSLGLKK